jgi:hypothetical protein
MIEHVSQFGVQPQNLTADKAYGSGEFLAWLLERNIQPHIPVIDRRHQTQGHFTREEFRYKSKEDAYYCPEGKPLDRQSSVPLENHRKERSSDDLRGVHRRWRERRPLPGMLLHIDRGRHVTAGSCRQAGGFPNGQGVWFPPVVYQAEFTFEQSGLSGLLPQKRGPRNGHKLTPQVMEFATELRTAEPSLSIERQLLREKNSDKHAARSPCRTAGERWMDCPYEEPRRQILNGQRGPGLVIFMRRGMREWMNAWSPCVAPSPAKERTAAPDEAILPQGARTEVVLILAGMLLHGYQERVVRAFCTAFGTFKRHARSAPLLSIPVLEGDNLAEDEFKMTRPRLLPREWV